MPKPKYSGYFISIEGIDGCGKSTQIELVKNYVENLGYEVHLTREPGKAGLLEDKIRSLVMSPKYKLNPLTEVFLYAADRAEHYSAEIIPLLKQGFFIISDRSYDSTMAYQGYGREMNLSMMEYLIKLATFNTETDLTLVLDLPVETANKRIKTGEFGNSKDRIEQESIEFHKRIRQGYLEIAEREPHRIKIIDASRSIEEVFESVKDEINKLLGF